MGTFDAELGREWMETDGLGGFASGTVSTIRTRRYHALLLAAENPPSDRWVHVNGLEVWIEVGEGRHPLSSQRYGGGVTHPDGARRIVEFEAVPWPTWRYRVPGLELVHELFVVRGQPTVVARWSVKSAPLGARLVVRPLMSGRDPHHLQRETPQFPHRLVVDGGRLTFGREDGVPSVHAASNGIYTHAPEWYRNFFYAEEAARGLDAIEDLASPGYFTFDLASDAASLILTTDGGALTDAPATALADRLAHQERERRRAFSGPLVRAAEHYVVRRGDNHTVIAGYPWFGDWGRDTFIALRGLRYLDGGPELAASILREWATVVSKGMLPNRFPDRGDQPEYNSVDASLWYVLAVRDHLDGPVAVSPAVRAALLDAVTKILDGYAGGTRYGIRADDQGLLCAGVQGVQLTWMDAKVGDWVVTPRIGKPVEIQALWLNALDFGRRTHDRFEDRFQRGTRSFFDRFYDPGLGYLRDVVDVEHHHGRHDGRLRPNQVFALGALSRSLVEQDLARAIMTRLEDTLWTPMGPRSLAPHEPCFIPRYEGGVRQRDGAYHQGTVWPWLTGPFVDAWVWSHGGTEAVQREARRRFLDPLLADHLGDAGVGHVSEIADAVAPHTPRGAPFQAWSMTELFRLDRTLAR